MSELDKVIAALVAVEVNKQLGERNSLPNVKRAAVTADEWRALILLEAWRLAVANPSTVTIHYKDGFYWHLFDRDLVSYEGYVDGGLISDAIHNINAPAKFRGNHYIIEPNDIFGERKGRYRLK